jgi:RNA polymerase-binding transcription factor DksA
MESARVRLDREFKLANDRFRRTAAPAALEQLLGRAVDGVQFADEVDEIQASESLEIGLATRALLVARVARLASALHRVATGEYGLCIACGERITLPRLRALPEVETCVHCQDRLERGARERRTSEGS